MKYKTKWKDVDFCGNKICRLHVHKDLFLVSVKHLYKAECIRTVLFLMTAARTTAVSPCAVAAVVVVAVAVVILYPLLLLLSVERRVRH